MVTGGGNDRCCDWVAVTDECAAAGNPVGSVWGGATWSNCESTAVRRRWLAGESAVELGHAWY
jgi:hypothetical protein